MRLSFEEQKLLLEVVHAFFSPAHVEVYLHGSRTDDALKGGDIDLILVSDQMTKDRIAARTHYLLRDMKKVIGDQRIDVIVATQGEIDSDPFLILAMKKAVPIR